MRRLPAAIGAAWGLSLLLRPGQMLRLTGTEGASDPELVAVRVLGVRHMVEAILLAGAGPRVRVPIVLTESAHALSMVALAVGSPRFRRAAVVSASVAVSLARLSFDSSGRRSQPAAADPVTAWAR